MMKNISLVVITGLAGSGKSTAAKALEDNGYFVVDNLPCLLLPQLLETIRKEKKFKQLAVVIDARDPFLHRRFADFWRDVLEEQPKAQLLYLDASDAVLYKRFKETRRKHPLDQGFGLKESVRIERAVLGEVSALANWIVCTDALTVHDLRELVRAHMGLSSEKRRLTLSLMSFGFKHGIPPEADLVFDARFLHNPFFVPGLREKTGLQKSVSNYVLKDPAAADFMTHIVSYVTRFLSCYEKEGKAYMTLAIGCTGGVHRAPALTEQLAKILRKHRHTIRIEHRDINKH